MKKIQTTLAILLALLAAAPAWADNQGDIPINPYLADSPWPMSHANPYCQASSRYRGLEGKGKVGDAIQREFKRVGVGPITLCWSAPYSDGKRVVWGSALDRIFKADLSGKKVRKIAMLKKPFATDPISGAYTLIDKDNRFYAPHDSLIEVYQDAVANDRLSGIVKAGAYAIPKEKLEKGEHIVGLNLTYDGFLAFVTEQGLVGLVSRDFKTAHFLRIPGKARVSNSLALDEDHGLYVVTETAMHRVQWTGKGLSLDPADGAWSAAYPAGPEKPVSGRLGRGSGTTPTLMGSGNMDCFVAIADGQKAMHMVLFWRKDIPHDWRPVSPGADRRIAAMVPITFGKEQKERITTEQSLCVSGYSAVAVSNDYGNLPDTSGIPGYLGKLNIMFTNLPFYAPKGVEKFTWDPSARSLKSAWANAEISCPNGIPCMSTTSNLLYCWGQREMVWTLEALDWDTGQSVFYKTLGPLLKYNSSYAATEIGPDQTMASGTMGGLVRLKGKNIQ